MMSNGKWGILIALILWNMASGYCQQMDGENIIPKGEYIHVSTTTKQVSYSETLYEADAAIINNTWQTNGFHLEEDAFTTGAYGANQSFRAVSPSFGLPLQREGTRIYIKIDSRLHSESYNDGARLRMINAKTGESYTLYSASGISGRSTEYIDISHYSGYTVQLELSFTSDSTYNGDGWSIYSVSIVGDYLYQNRGLRTSPSTMRMTRDLDGNSTNGNESMNTYLQNMRVDIVDVTPKDEYRGTVSFTLTDMVDNTIKFIPLDKISANDFLIKVAGREANICSNLRGSQNDKLDVIYAVDCSGSMSNMQQLLDSSVTPLTEGIKNHFNALFAEVQFGFSDSPFGTAAKRGYNLDCPYWHCSKFINADKFELEYFTNGGTELYYQVLDEITRYKFDGHRADAQKTIIMIGDENIDGWVENAQTANHSYDNAKDCKEGVEQNILTQDSVVTNLRAKGYQTIIINRDYYDEYFNKITQKTKGKYIGASVGASGDLGFGVDSVVQFLVSNLKHRYFLDYCLDTTYRCDTIIDVSLKIKDSNVMDATKTNIEYMPLITRDSATMAYDEHGYHCNGNIRIAFDVSNYCENDEVKAASVLFSVDGGQSFDTIVAQMMGSMYVAYIQQDSIPEGTRKIDYRISVQMQNGRFIATSPQVTNTMGDTWTIPVCCENNICAPMPKVTDVSWNCDSVLLVKVKNVNPADSINVFFMYNNGYKEGTLAAQYTYVPVKMTDFTEQEGEWIYSMKIPDDVVNQHLAYFVYIVDKNGLKSWYGNGNETMHDAEFTLDCEPDFCGSLQLSMNPIRSDSCVLSFTLLKERMVNFKIFHTDGTPLEYGNKTLSVDKGCVAGENQYNMNELFNNIFDMGINPREPLILSVSTGNHVAMAYFYVSRVKGKK